MHIKRLLWVLFGLYCIVMLWLLFGQRIGHNDYGLYFDLLFANLNVVPFRTVTEYASVLSGSAGSLAVRHAIINLGGNIIMFVPLGFFLPCLFPLLRGVIKYLVFQIAVIVIIELVQLFTLLGSCDIDDLIFNTAGAFIGFLLFRMVYNARLRRMQKP